MRSALGEEVISIIRFAPHWSSGAWDLYFIACIWVAGIWPMRFFIPWLHFSVGNCLSFEKHPVRAVTLGEVRAAWIEATLWPLDLACRINAFVIMLAILVVLGPIVWAMDKLGESRPYRAADHYFSDPTPTDFQGVVPRAETPVRRKTE
jgi:hypothetical protein